MKKIWRVAVYEYRRNVFKRGFLLVLASVPFMMTLSLGFGFLIESLKDSGIPVGIVDDAGVFMADIPAPVASGMGESVEFIFFQTETEAQAFLEAGKIQAFYFLPADYADTRHLKLVYLKQPGENASREFYNYLQVNLLASRPADLAFRAAVGTQVTVRSWNGRREVSGDGPTFGLMMPLLITIAFLGLLLMNSGYLMSAFVDEKENRTIEILATSISPGQLIGGKVLGIVAIGLTMLVVWAAVVVLAVLIAREMGFGWFQNLELDWSTILAMVAVALPAYVLVSALMVTIGSLSTTTQEGQSVTSVFVILHLAPIYVSLLYLNSPHSPLAVVMSLLPFTALLTISMRNIFAIVPAWQVVASVCVQVICALVALWLAGRAFRLGMLRYGQRLGWRRLLRSG